MRYEDWASEKMDRKMNAARNAGTGMILKIYQTLCPFVMRTLVIYLLGMEYAGLNNLFQSIIHVLNLSELGVSLAMVYCMYRPIAEGNQQMICSLMRLYRLYYTVIGAFILVAGIAITPYVPGLISGDVPQGISVYILYWINLSATVLSYWMFAYKGSLLTAHQRMDILNKISIAVSIVQTILQLVLLLFFQDYYLYVSVILIGQVLNNILINTVTGKMYPEYKPSGEMDRQLVKRINAHVRDLFTSKVGEVIVTSVDSIVISAFLGLTMLAVYNNYYFILSSVMGIVVTLFTASTAGIGNSLVTETAGKNYKDLCRFTFLISWISCFCVCCFLNLYQPFITLWIGEEYLLDMGCVVCFCVYFYVRMVNQVLIVYKDAGGIWHKDRFRPLITGLVNLTLNLVMVRPFGVYGIILSTVLSVLLVGMPWVIHNIFKEMFHRSPFHYLGAIVRYTVVTLVAVGLSYAGGRFLTGNLVFVIAMRLLICFMAANLVYLASFWGKEELTGTARLLDGMFGVRIPFAHHIFTKLMDSNRK